ncbi:NADPH:quinone oxidoreductase family protein [Pseudonocardia sp. NPDC049154]|uniref:NADPH:quinone oxidoreductase family protein n=1 Tax=Pseudonocardia sp. NPDC049154 TaxID=3155501 RepID=UPI0033DC482F
MRALSCVRYGTPEELETVEVPDPTPGPGQILVEVHAAGVNFPDVLMIAGTYQTRQPVPFVPGGEFSGRVVGLGPGVIEPAVGTMVMGTGGTGAFAECLVIDAAAAVPVPAGLDAVSAAAFSVTTQTAYHSLVTTAAAQTGEWVVVTGAAGGVGLACVDVGTRLGLNVIAAASSPQRLALAAEHGAVAGIDYAREDLKARIKELTGGGANVVIDPVGGPYAEEALRALRYGGRFVTVGYASGEIPRIPLNLVLLKGISILGIQVGALPKVRPEAMGDAYAALAGLAEGGLRPHVSARFPLAEAATALRAVADRRVTGKVVLTLPACADEDVERETLAIGRD